MTTQPERLRFSEFIAQHRNGVADADIAEALANLAEKCARLGKSGSLTLTLKVSPQGDMLGIADTLTVKAPNATEERLYWLDLAGRLTRNNPLQPQLPLNETAAD